MSSSTTLKGVSQWGNSLLSDSLEFNCYMFFSWGMLGIGAFTNVTIPASGAFGGDKSRLRPSEDPNYVEGQVWEGFRGDWVWETGVEYPTQPIRVSGVRVNGTFHPASGIGAYKHTVNYPLGRVIFDTAISPSSTVTCEYSYRACHLTTSDSLWWKQIQQNSLRVDDPTFLQNGSGNWSMLGQNRVQLPAIVFEAPLQVNQQVGFELGNEIRTVQEALTAHILADTPWDRKQLHDIVSYQWEKRLVAVDKNRLLADNKFPLDSDGSPTASGLMYPSMILPSGQGGYLKGQLRVIETRSFGQGARPPLYYASVRLMVETDIA